MRAFRFQFDKIIENERIKIEKALAGSRIFCNFAADIVTAVGTKLPEDVATNVNILNINIYNGFN